MTQTINTTSTEIYRNTITDDPYVSGSYLIKTTHTEIWEKVGDDRVYVKKLRNNVTVETYSAWIGDSTLVKIAEEKGIDLN